MAKREYGFQVGDKFIGYGDVHRIDSINQGAGTACVCERWQSEDDGEYMQTSRILRIDVMHFEDYDTEVLLGENGAIQFYATNVANREIDF